MGFKTKRGRGQVSGFTILGIIIVAVVVLLFFLRGQLGIVLPGSLKSTDIKEHVHECLKETAPEYIERLGRQGGYLSTPEGTFRPYEDVPVSYLCYSIEKQPNCRNRMLTLEDMQKELANAIGKGLDTCIDYGSFRKRGYDLSAGQMDIVVEIGKDITRVTMKQSIRMTKGDVVVSEEEFSENFDYPLGRLYDVSQEIVNVEATAGEFDQMPFMLAHKGEYIIDKKRPYPDKLYIMQTKDSPYVFQFFIEGEPTAT